MKRRQIQFEYLLCSALLAYALSLPAANPAFAWDIGTPITYYWDGPDPLTADVAQWAVNGGYNHVTVYSIAELQVAEQYGLRAELSHPLLSLASLYDAQKRSQLNTLIDQFKASPAAYSYYIKDEPGAWQFPGLSALTGYLRQRDPDRLGFINLFPRHPVVMNSDLGTTGDSVTAYNSYLRAFVNSVNPGLISYDHYHFMSNGTDAPEYFLNLELVRRMSVETGIPFSQAVQSAAIGNSFRLPTTNEMRFLYYTTLAYGAQGISNFLYKPTNPNSGGIAPNPDGSPTEIYQAVQSLNPQFVAIANQLQPLNSLGTFHEGMLPPGTTPLPQDSPFALTPGVSEQPYVEGQQVKGYAIGLFGAGDSVSDASYALIVNLDYTTDKTVTVTGTGELSVYNAVTETWTDLHSNSATLYLWPGGGKMIRLSNSLVSIPEPSTGMLLGMVLVLHALRLRVSMSFRL
ncbi:MAG: hypothetical protein IT445_19815 [Phycisphaeraceae bacterium]|nr:hypothetical protein [Phycisphaeraceae bacterium]